MQISWQFQNESPFNKDPTFDQLIHLILYALSTDLKSSGLVLSLSG